VLSDVVALLLQTGQLTITGMRVEAQYADVYTVRDGRQSRIDVYSDREQALVAVGLAR
jgi:ketosteroid isomerase-like protein